MRARRLATILQAMTLAEAMETTRVYGVAGLTGGGQILLPGEVSRAHHGILCLDELPACTCPGLEVWRQPREKAFT
jgi:magnesium chelatase family protein